MSTNASKVSFSVPSDSIDELDAIASALGVTRSAALSAILSRTLSQAQNHLAVVAKTNYELQLASAKRYTSSSKDQIDCDLEALILGEG